jgi:hypothetical protein
MRWDTVWAVLHQYVLHYMLRSPIGLPPCSSFCSLVSEQSPCFYDSRERTGTGLRTRSVSLMNSCGLALINICWVGRIIIMRVGCMARTRVALNIAAVSCEGWWSGECVGRRELGVFVTGTLMGKLALALWQADRKKPSGQCAERGQTIRLRSPTSLRHDRLPPAIAPTPTPNTPQTHP